MRIAHVVTYISPDGAFGGPVRVALGQAEALASRGHEVTVYAGAPVDSPKSAIQDGYTLKTFPAKFLSKKLGFAGLRAPTLTRALRNEATRIDVAHIHLARDLVTLPAVRALRQRGVPYVVQPHGMVDRSNRALARPIDRWETRAALLGASSVFALTDEESQELAFVAPGVHTLPISNGVKLNKLPDYGGRENLVLYLARLHPRKRAPAFVEMAEIVGRENPELRFVIAGPDEGDGPVVQSLIESSALQDRIQWIGAVAPGQTSSLLKSARIYVLPAVDEVFPMSLLEAFAAGTPSVVTDSLGIASKCEDYGAALVSDRSPNHLADAVRELYQNHELSMALREGAEKMLRESMNIGEVADMLETEYLKTQAE